MKSLNHKGYVVFGDFETGSMKMPDRATHYYCRFRPLGLTAYGLTPEEAEVKLRRMFASDVDAHLGLGTLEDMLRRSGVQWI